MYFNHNPGGVIFNKFRNFFEVFENINLNVLFYSFLPNR